MTKPELVEELMKQSSLTKPQAEMIVTTIFDAMADALVHGDKVELRRFGSFRIRHRGSRVGQTPTHRAVKIPARRVPFFKAAREVRKVVRALS